MGAAWSAKFKRLGLPIDLCGPHGLPIYGGGTVYQVQAAWPADLWEQHGLPSSSGMVYQLQRHGLLICRGGTAEFKHHGLLICGAARSATFKRHGLPILRGQHSLPSSSSMTCQSIYVCRTVYRVEVAWPAD